MDLLRRMAVAAILACLPARSQEIPESAVKAAYLLRFADYVEWPADRTAGPLIVGVLGEDPFGEVLDQAAQARGSKGRPVMVLRVKDASRLPSLHILYFASAEGAHWQELQQSLRGRGVLTVGESAASPWAAIVFVRVRDRVRFRTNIPAAEDAGVKLGSRLQSLSWKEGS